MAKKIVVLVVEDEPLIRMDVVDQLSDEGFEVIEAGNVAEAIQILVANPAIQVVFTDIDMPGGADGLELAAAVRDRWPPIKIIVTSGHRLVEITDLPDGSVFFSKPYRHRDVVTTIRDMHL